MYPFLKQRIVVVHGHEAAGVYDLNTGSFQRVNRVAGEFLLALDGTHSINSFEKSDQAFLDSCDVAGFVDWQHQPHPQSPTRLEDVIRPIRPVKFAWIELTSKCNQFCKHCFLGTDLNAHPPFLKSDVFDMLHTLEAAGARQIIFSGGEPSSHPDFLDILEYAGSRFPFKLSLLTNASHGSLMLAIEALVKYEVTVKIPILGWDDSHDAMAGRKGVFAATTKNIDRLVSAGVHVELGTTVTGLNYHDVPQIRDYAGRLGLRLEVSPLYAVGYAETNRAELYSITQEQIIQTCSSENDKSSLVRIESSSLSDKSPREASRERYKVDPYDYDAVNLRDYLTAHSECGQKIIAVLSNRNVTPCLMLRSDEFSLGSLYENSFREILEHVAMRSESFDQLMSLEKIPGCNGCEARFACKAGGCPASAKAFAGSVQVKNPLFKNCYYANDDTRAEVGLSPLS